MQISKSLPSPLITIPISETVAASPHRQSQCLYVIINSGCWPLARATTRSSNFLCVVRARSFPRRSAHLRFSHESQPTEVDRIDRERELSICLFQPFPPFLSRVSFSLSVFRRAFPAFFTELPRFLDCGRERGKRLKVADGFRGDSIRIDREKRKLTHIGKDAEPRRRGLRVAVLP